MKTLILVALVVLSFGLEVANAQSLIHNYAGSPGDRHNFTRGGGG